MEEQLDGLKRRIDEARVARGQTRAALAEAIGVSPSTVSEWYTKGTTPSAWHVIRLVEELGVSADWLLLGRGPRERAAGGTTDPYAVGIDVATRAIIKEVMEMRRNAGLTALPLNADVSPEKTLELLRLVEAAEADLADRPVHGSGEESQHRNQDRDRRRAAGSGGSDQAAPPGPTAG